MVGTGFFSGRSKIGNGLVAGTIGPAKILMKQPGRLETPVNVRHDSIEEEEGLDDFLIDIDDKQDLDASHCRPSSAGGKSVCIMMESPLTPNLADTETDGSNETISPVSPPSTTRRDSNLSLKESRFLDDIEEEEGSFRLVDLTDTSDSPDLPPISATYDKQQEKEKKKVLTNGSRPKSNKNETTEKRPEIRRRNTQNSVKLTSPKTPRSTKSPITPITGKTTPDIPDTPGSSKSVVGSRDDGFLIDIKDKSFLSAEQAKTFMRDLDLPEYTADEVKRQNSMDNAVKQKSTNNTDEGGSSSSLGNEEDPEAIRVKTPTPPPPSGLTKLVDTFEENGYITPKNVKEFMEDLELPLFSNRVLLRKMRDVGASERGFEDLNDFFAFVQNECKPIEKDPVGSFQVFDKSKTGEMSEFQLRRIIREMGDPLHADDVSKCMEFADQFKIKDGDVNYEHILSHFLETQYDPLKESESSRNADKLKSVKSCWI